MEAPLPSTSDNHLARASNGLLLVSLLCVLLATSSGATAAPLFEAGLTYRVGMLPFTLAAGDFNSDGKPDLVVSNDGSDNVSLLIGNGDGSFQPAVNFGVDGFP